MLTALGEEENRIAGLQLGADDYVTKPFSPRELALRVSSVLRTLGRGRSGGRARTAPTATCGSTSRRRRATLGGAELALTTREFDLLVFLLTHPGQAFTREQLLETGVGLGLRRSVHGDRPRATVAGEDRGDPGEADAGSRRCGESGTAMTLRVRTMIDPSESFGEMLAHALHILPVALALVLPVVLLGVRGCCTGCGGVR